MSSHEHDWQEVARTAQLHQPRRPHALSPDEDDDLRMRGTITYRCAVCDEIRQEPFDVVAPDGTDSPEPGLPFQT